MSDKSMDQMLMDSNQYECQGCGYVHLGHPGECACGSNDFLKTLG